MSASDTPLSDSVAREGEYRTDQGCTITLQSWDYKQDPDGEVVLASDCRAIERRLNDAVGALEQILETQAFTTSPVAQSFSMCMIAREAIANARKPINEN